MPPVNTASMAESIPGPNNLLSESTSIIGKAIERETGVSSFREVLANATQTGAEEQVDEMVDLAKALLNNPGMKAEVNKAAAA